MINKVTKLPHNLQFGQGLATSYNNLYLHRALWLKFDTCARYIQPVEHEASALASLMLSTVFFNARDTPSQRCSQTKMVKTFPGHDDSPL